MARCLAACARRLLIVSRSKGTLHERPSWSLFARVNEGSETILFREKFVDWPEPGRIIKMRGHESSGEIVKVLRNYYTGTRYIPTNLITCTGNSNTLCDITVPLITNNLF